MSHYVENIHTKNGTSINPGFAFENDPDTGLFLESDGKMSVSVGNNIVAKYTDSFEIPELVSAANPDAGFQKLYFDSVSKLLYRRNSSGSTFQIGGTDLSMLSNGMVAINSGLPVARTLTGTTNQISIANGDGTGNPTFSLPQNINTTNSPTFAGLTLTGFSGVVLASAGSLSAGQISSSDISDIADFVMDSDFSTTGILIRTGTNTYAERTITGTADQISVSNGNGISGNPTLSLPQSINTTNSPTFAGLTLTGFSGIVKSSAGVLSASAISTSDLTDVSNIIFDSDFSATGIMTRTSANNYEGRTLTGTSNQISISNGNGVSGNPTFSLPQDIATSSSVQFGKLLLNTGSLTNAKFSIGGASENASTGPNTAIYVDGNTHPIKQDLNWDTDNIYTSYDGYFNGTNWIRSGTSAPFLITKLSNALNFKYASASTAGSSFSWTTAASISSSGVFDISSLKVASLSGMLYASSGTVGARTLTGTANQVNISNGDGISGAPTFSLPQSIATSSDVQFGTLGLGSTPISSLVQLQLGTRSAISTTAKGMYIEGESSFLSVDTGSILRWGIVKRYGGNTKIEVGSGTDFEIARGNAISIIGSTSLSTLFYLGSGYSNIASKLYINTTSSTPSSGIATCVVYGTTNSSSAPALNIVTSQDSRPAMQILSYSHDSTCISIDAYSDYSNWIAGSSFPVQISKSGSALAVNYASSSAGSTISWSTALSLSSAGVFTINSLKVASLTGMLYASSGNVGARTITGTSNQITVTNGDGVSGNPTLSLPQDINTNSVVHFGKATAGTSSTSYDTGKINVYGVDTNTSTGPNMFFYTSADSLPLLEIMPYSHDNIQIKFDNYHNGTNEILSSSTAFRISKGSTLSMEYATGTAGGTASFTSGFSLSATGVTTLSSLVIGSLSGMLYANSGTVGVRTLTGTTDQINISNGDGISGAPTFSLPQSINTTNSPTFAGLTLTGFSGVVKATAGVLSTGTLASTDLSDTADIIYDSDFSTTGIMARTGTGTFSGRTLTGTTDQINISNGNGVSGNPTFSLPQSINTTNSPTFAGLTLTGFSGVLVATAGVISGSAYSTDLADTADIVYDSDFSTTGMMARTGTGTFSGRTLTGTTNQISISNGNGVSGNPTFSLPQDIATSSTVRFGKLGLETSTVPFETVGLAKLAIHGTNTSINGPHAQFTTDLDNYPLISIIPWGHDNIALAFDAFTDGTDWKSSDAGSSFRVYKNSDALSFQYAVGTLGSNLTFADSFSISNAGSLTITGDSKFDGTVNLNDSLSATSATFSSTATFNGGAVIGSLSGMLYASSGTVGARTLTGTTNQISISNGDGISGAPTFSLPQDIATSSTVEFGKLLINGASGDYSDLAVRGNNTRLSYYSTGESVICRQEQVLTSAYMHSMFGAYHDGTWWKRSSTGIPYSIAKIIDTFYIFYGDAGAAGGDVNWNTGLSLDSSGVITIPSLKVSSLSGMLYASSGTVGARTLTGTTNQISISNGDGISGNPTFSLPQDIATSSNVRFGQLGVGLAATSTNPIVGYFSTATATGLVKLANGNNTADDEWWIGFNHGTNIADSNDRARFGCTIVSSGAGKAFISTGLAGAQAKNLIVDENGLTTLTSLKVASLSGMLYASSGTVGARTLTGTTNQVSISNGTGVSGNPTFSLPQDIATSSTVQFGKLSLNGGSTTYTRLAIQGTSGNVANGPSMTMYYTGDARPGMQLFPHTHDNIQLKFDMYHDGTNEVLSSTSAFRFAKGVATFGLYGMAGTTGGTISSMNTLFLGTAAGYLGVGNTSAPTNPFEINAGGALWKFWNSGTGLTSVFDCVHWANGVNINQATGGKHLYIGRDNPSTSHTYVGKDGLEATFSSTDGQVSLSTNPSIQLLAGTQSASATTSRTVAINGEDSYLTIDAGGSHRWGVVKKFSSNTKFLSSVGYKFCLSDTSDVRSHTTATDHLTIDTSGNVAVSVGDLSVAGDISDATYANGTWTLTVSGCFSRSIDIKYCRRHGFVFITLPYIVETASSTSYYLISTIPSGYRPTVPFYNVIWVNGPTSDIGNAIVNDTGTIEIYYGLTGNFTSGSNCGHQQTILSWPLV